MKNMKNNLDERQEQALLRIEHNGCWIAFFGLAAAILVQAAMGGGDFTAIAGESLILLVLSVYLAAACMKNGIWDRRLKPNALTNLIVSLTAALVTGGMMFLRVYRNYPEKPAGSAAAGVFAAAFTFALCFAVLTISAAAYKKRQKKLEQEQDEEE